MNILVTGATGFVGYYITQRLIADGHHVVGMYRSENRGYHRLQQQFSTLSLIPANLLDYDSLEQACDGIELIVHNAAAVAINNSSETLLKKTNLLGTTHLINAAIENKVKRMIYISSIAAIGGADDELNINEETKWNPKTYHNAYAQSKRDAEMEVWRGNVEGLSAVVLQPSVIIGEWDQDHHASQFFNRLKNGLFLAPTGSTGWVDVRDVADAVAATIDKNIHQEKIIISGHSLSFRHMIEKTLDVIGKRNSLFALPRGVAYTGAYVIQSMARLFGVKTLISTDAIRAVYSTHLYENEKSKQLLELKYRPVDESIKFALADTIFKPSIV